MPQVQDNKLTIISSEKNTWKTADRCKQIHIAPPTLARAPTVLHRCYIGQSQALIPGTWQAS